MKNAVKKSFGRRRGGCVDNIRAMIRVLRLRSGNPVEWKNLKDPKKGFRNIPDFIRDVVEPINSMKGDELL